MDTQPELTTSKDIINYLSSQFPNCFTIEGDAKPLKIGIFQDIAERLADDNRFSKTKLRIALRLYTASWRYLYCIKDGANRVDLDGNTCGEITSEQVEHAQAQLKESKDKVKAKRIAQQKEKNPRPQRADKPKSKSTNPKKVNNTKKREPKPTPTLKKISIEQLKVGDAVKVVLGSKPVPVVVSGIEKENIKVKASSGMELTVTVDHILM